MPQVGKYQLIRKLATGGMAEVFLAKAAGPRGFEKTLVLKRILPHLAEDPSFVEMFLSEARLAAQLNHPNIVQIFDFGEADDAFFIAMEFIDGPNLRVLLKRASAQGVALPTALCARLIASACEGLAFAHDFLDPTTGEHLELIHRDISPDNILVSRQGAVKVVDFGIAKAAGQSHRTQNGVIKGKLAYMPPEQIRAKHLDRRVDVYALGVVFYELLTGSKPYEAPSDASLMQAILFDPMVHVRERRPDLPEALQRILERALAKDREQRYPDCLALSADLEDFILSVGKPVTTQQLVQLIALVTPNTDSPLPTPPPGTPKSGSRRPVTPTPTSVPSMVVPLDSSQRPTIPERPWLRPALKQPAPPSPGIPPEPQGPPTDVTPTPAPRWNRKKLLGVAAAGLILAVGSGYLLSRQAADPVQPPASAPLTSRDTPEPRSTPIPTAVAPVRPKPPPPRTPLVPRPQTQPLSATSVALEGRNDGGVENSSHEPEEPPIVAERILPPRNEPARASTPPRQKSSSRPRPSKTPKTTSSTPVEGRGTVTFRVRPFATIFVNGTSLGQTPFAPVELPAGTYQVRFVNDDLKKDLIQVHQLKAGESKTIKLNLEE